MNTETLNFFLKIASGETYLDVAEDCNISQSSISKAIRHLEEDLGVELFNRKKRNVTLTSAGKVFYEGISQIKPQFDAVLKQMEKFQSEKNVSITIVPNFDYLDLDVHLSAQKFLEGLKNIKLNILPEHEPDLALASLQSNQTDFVISHLFDNFSSVTDSITLYDDTLYLIVPKIHHFVGKESIDFVEILNEPILLSSEIIKKVIQDICEKKHLPPPKYITPYDHQFYKRYNILSRVAMGYGITLYFKSDLMPYNLDDLYLIPITDIPEYPVALFWKANHQLSIYQEMVRAQILIMMSKLKDMGIL